ncbi:hypothetical protein Moror_9481 [Moniliophthora roreri MCA 2997]|uniref:Uncharacterized protein n=2 Tax=Moniliophthora roreri TaxID=221103 RepID=V2WZI2_MONRO|nr:hypothetical protein Moror_9481 [Moniliophthora roreri MCA 2997]KAI3599104.1 hypothetical protein WG66_004030 [Moniliophthora roreri]
MELQDESPSSSSSASRIPSLTSLSTTASSPAPTSPKASPSEKLLRETLVRDGLGRRRSLGASSSSSPRPGHRKRNSVSSLGGAGTGAFWGLGLGWFWREPGEEGEEDEEILPPLSAYTTPTKRERTRTEPARLSHATPPLPPQPRHANSYPFTSSPRTSPRIPLTMPNSTPRRKFTLGLETVPSISDLRGGTSSSLATSSSPSASPSDGSMGIRILTPPPTPPFRHLDLGLGIGASPSISRRRRQSLSLAQMQAHTHTSLPGTPTRGRYTDLPSEVAVPRHRHTRALSVQVPGVRTNPCTPQKNILPLPLPTPPSPTHPLSLAFNANDTPRKPGFNARRASETCKRIEGMVSFANIEGLGEPESAPQAQVDDADEDLTTSSKEQRTKKWLGLF